LRAAYKHKTQKLRYTKKITLSLYRYVCMHASYESSTAAHVSSNARAGTGRCSSNFLFTYVFDGSIYTCIQKCMYFQNVCNCFGVFFFVNFECSLFAFYWFLLSLCCFTSLQLLGLCSVVGHHLLQEVMLVAASLNRALVHLNHLKDHYNQ